MTYSKQNFQDGDILTAAQLNAMDDQIKLSADAALQKAGGTMTGALILAGAPASDNGAATRRYVDERVGCWYPVEDSGGCIGCYPAAGSAIAVTAHVAGAAERATVRRCGKNLANIAEVATIDCIVSGTHKAYNGLLFPGGATYTVGIDDGSNVYVYAYTVSNVGGTMEMVGNSNMYITIGNPDSGRKHRTYSVPQGEYLFVFDAHGGHGTNAARTMLADRRLQVELGSACTEYEEYHGDVYDVQLPEGFAGGDVEVAGVIALPGRNMLTIDVGSLTASWYADPIRIINDLAARIEALENIQ